jgi:hypothetical protein
MLIVCLIISFVALGAEQLQIHLLPALYLTGPGGFMKGVYPKTPISLIIDERTGAVLRKFE